jgi:protein CpxP
MSDTTETRKPSHEESPRRRFFRRAAIATLIAGVATGVGFRAFAHGGPGGWHCAGSMHGPLDPAMLDAHLDRILQHVYVDINATDAQKQQIDPIVKGAAKDLLPLRTKMRDARRQAVQLLASDHVDRTALEALRADQIRLADGASRRLTQALADVADVLTPDQRKQLAERIGRWHGGRG